MDEFHFRWLNIEGYHISVVLFFNPLKWNCFNLSRNIMIISGQTMTKRSQIFQPQYLKITWIPFFLPVSKVIKDTLPCCTKKGISETGHLSKKVWNCSSKKLDICYAQYHLILYAFELHNQNLQNKYIFKINSSRYSYTRSNLDAPWSFAKYQKWFGLLRFFLKTKGHGCFGSSVTNNE